MEAALDCQTQRTHNYCHGITETDYPEKHGGPHFTQVTVPLRDCQTWSETCMEFMGFTSWRCYFTYCIKGRCSAGWLTDDVVLLRNIIGPMSIQQEYDGLVHAKLMAMWRNVFVRSNISPSPKAKGLGFIDHLSLSIAIVPFEVVHPTGRNIKGDVMFSSYRCMTPVLWTMCMMVKWLVLVSAGRNLRAGLNTGFHHNLGRYLVWACHSWLGLQNFFYTLKQGTIELASSAGRSSNRLDLQIFACISSRGYVLWALACRCLVNLKVDRHLHGKCVSPLISYLDSSRYQYCM